MSEIPLKQQLLEMSLDGIRDVIKVIQSRPDIYDVSMMTEKEKEELSERVKNFILEVPDESA